MSQDGAEPFLQEMRMLISKGLKHFVRRNRDGKSYIQMLADLGLTSIEEAWDYVLELTKEHYISGPQKDLRDGPDGPLVIWVFKMNINGIPTYVKLKNETAERGCVCISFHPDEPS